MIRTLLHFIVLGGICFALAQWRESTRAAEPSWAGESAARTIRISATRIDALRDEWSAETGSEPSESELRASLEAAIDEEILFREALRMGLLRTDPVVRQRLVQNMRFLGISSRDEAASFRQALQLGMARSDLVVRRRLVQRMQALLEATSSPVDETEVREHVRRHPEAFRASPKFRLSYIYLERGADAEAGRTPVLEIASRYLALGVEHLLTGADHLLFVSGLMLLVPGPRALVASVTAFTLGHSVTLLLATLGWVRFPTQWVEVAIAGSLLVLAVGVVHRGSGAGRTPLARHSWGMAFGFGLLHGLGFAGALASVGLPESAIPLALFSFNLGIELGQLCFIAIVGTALLALQRLPPLPWLRLVPAYAMGTLAAYWCFERSRPLF